MQEIANRELTPEMIEAFKMEQRRLDQKGYHEHDDIAAKSRKSKGEKKRAKRDRRKYRYA